MAASTNRPHDRRYLRRAEYGKDSAQAEDFPGMRDWKTKLLNLTPDHLIVGEYPYVTGELQLLSAYLK